ncbi:MAG TPA: hypothetical protein VHW64_17780 [Nocardioides sp.]|jgi:hypothetical protein|uniref:hypothetical protein n=1 Tax=Nocardioides sp. TaxID=35761 RepID=UPI002E34928D|nr:hypothetical protein [Nocardioides sp.]HEX3932550.1 hypothetical protein [Nocardioides sp.]
MLVSGREAVRILRRRGGITGEAQARSLLRSGLAGSGVITDTGLYFDRDAVRALADRPWLDESAQQAACPAGAYIARLPRADPPDLTRPWADVVDRLDRVPRMPAMTVALLDVSVSAGGRLPWVATLDGFVVVGADLLGLTVGDDGSNRFRLERPGEWFEVWRGARLRGSRGGRPWIVRRPRAA